MDCKTRLCFLSATSSWVCTSWEQFLRGGIPIDIYNGLHEEVPPERLVFFSPEVGTRKLALGEVILQLIGQPLLSYFFRSKLQILN